MQFVHLNGDGLWPSGLVPAAGSGTGSRHRGGHDPPGRGSPGSRSSTISRRRGYIRRKHLGGNESRELSGRENQAATDRAPGALRRICSPAGYWRSRPSPCLEASDGRFELGLGRVPGPRSCQDRCPAYEYRLPGSNSWAASDLMNQYWGRGEGAAGVSPRLPSPPHTADPRRDRSPDDGTCSQLLTMVHAIQDVIKPHAKSHGSKCLWIIEVVRKAARRAGACCGIWQR